MSNNQLFVAAGKYEKNGKNTSFELHRKSGKT